MMADWENLPELILAQIFSHLSVLDRVHVTNVCQSWAQAAVRSEVWRIFELAESDLSLVAANEELHYFDSDNDFVKMSLKNLYLNIIMRFGKYFSNVQFFYFGNDESCSLLKCLTEKCTHIKHINIQRCGGFDDICKPVVSTLLQRNTKLESITVKNLDSNTVSKKNEPTPIGLYHSQSLRKLWLERSFQACNLGNLMYLVRLRELVIEPCYLSYSLLFHLAGHSLRDLYIVALSKTTEFYNEALSTDQWTAIRSQGPTLRVHCQFGVSHEWTEKEVILKPSMPISVLVYQKYLLLNYLFLTPLVCNYSDTLRVFIDWSMSMESYTVARNARDIPVINRNLLKIVTCCQNLHTLAVKEMLASSTILAMVYVNRNLKNLHVMKQQLTYKHFTGICTDLTEDCLRFVEINSNTERFGDAVSSVVGYRWTPLQGSKFMEILMRKTALLI
ncbi:MAG: F-box-like domain-containing protein [Sedimenticola sp.]